MTARLPVLIGVLWIVWVTSPAAHAQGSVDGVTTEPPPIAESINLQSRLGEIEFVEGDAEIQIEHDGQTYTAERYLALIKTQQERRDAGGPVFRVFNITTAAGVLWVGLGLLGQVLFTARMVVQWLVSEKSKRSVVPPVFWYLSLIGASMLLAYFIWRKDIVGILGQATGWAIYARNVLLIRKQRADAGGVEG